MKTSKMFSASLIGLSSLLAFTSCEGDSDVKSTGSANVKVTDAAVDAENITGVFLSVKEIQAKGSSDLQVLATFDTAKVFNVMDYTEGATFDLGEGELYAGTYSELRLVLEEGSYVEFEDGSEEPLEVPSGTSSGYKIKGDFQISANNETDLVIDIDLRKAFVKTGAGDYILRPTARLIESEHTATIFGTVSANNEDRVVIYAYEKGTFEESEAAEPADGESRFENSINSAVVSDGEFTLAFMEPGEYDLIAVAYTYNETEETYEFKSATVADVMVNGSILGILELEADVDLTVLLMIEF